jgi:uncharacterized membrane protein
MNRWRNYGLWLSIFAFIPMLLKGFNIDVLPGNYDELVVAFLGILVLAGIINNPKEGNWYLDNK